MVKLVIKLTGLAVVVALAFASAVVWALGGPTEAQAIVRLDGAQAVPLTPFGLATCYAPGFTHAGFLAVRPGDSMATVRARIGKPLEIVWADRSDRRIVVFELQGERYVVVSRTYGMDLATGASMESVDPAKRRSAGSAMEILPAVHLHRLEPGPNRVLRRGTRDQAPFRRVLRLAMPNAVVVLPADSPSNSAAPASIFLSSGRLS